MRLWDMPTRVFKAEESRAVHKTCSSAMETQRKTGSVSFNNYKIFRNGGDGFNQWVILCLGLLNAVLLIVAVVLGINCAKVKEGSLHISNPAVTQLFSELDYLRSNHSDVIEAEEEAKKALESAINNHKEVKVKIEQLKTVNDGYQKQMQALQVEKANLKSNISVLEGSCGGCLPGWALFNSSCYFFSYTESSTVKKNWHESREDCVSRGSDLVVIDNQEEQKFISSNIQNMKTSDQWWQSGFWIGITDIETENRWVWINNVTEVEQRYWMDGEPNDQGTHGEDCGVAVSSIFNPWKTRFDGRCNWHNLHWICETPSTS
ncbi:C-type lectin domain family 4 member M [Haplochromis burtoni]|uniref:C-type lectin domain family 4 member M n=1 Tax=Haplochromis burtoni TaxID=8153 RepID=UPI0003BCE1C6|nr:C-type lectin domain family 4 member M [Haplochromis burtoni]